MSRTLRPPKAPNIPIAPVEYQQLYLEQLNNAFRLYFNQIDNLDAVLMSNRGGQYLNFPYGAFQDNTTQYDGSTTIPYAVRLDTTDYSNGVSVVARTVSSTAEISTTTMTVTAISAGRFYPGMLLSGTGVTSGTYVYLQLSSTAADVASHTFVSGGAIGATTVVLDSVANVEERQFISGTGLPANTRVVSVDTNTKTVTVSNAFTIQAAGTYTFKPWGYQGTYSVSPSQTVASTTILGSSSSKITVEQSGLYNIQFSLQFTNTDNAIQDIDIWFKKNDVSIPASNSQFTIPARKSAGSYGHLIAALNFMIELQANDYVEIVWHASSTTVYMETIPVQTAPIRPLTPSAIVTVSFVSELSA